MRHNNTAAATPCPFEKFDAMTSQTKPDLYRETTEGVLAVVEGEPDPVLRMATIAALVKAAFPVVSWCGFYRVDPQAADELIVGPYQGPLGCLRIPFSQGVCGAAARTRETVVVDDVHAFDGHIACDADARSEIVLPVFGPGEDLLAVLDLDSHEVAAFDQVDAAALRDLLDRVFRP